MVSRKKPAGNSETAPIVAGELLEFSIRRQATSTQLVVAFSLDGKPFTFVADGKILDSFKAFRTACLKAVGAMPEVKALDRFYRQRDAREHWQWMVGKAVKAGATAQ